LKIKTFVGTSANAVKTQVWTALIALADAEVPTTGVQVRLVVVQSDRLAAPATFHVSGSLPVGWTIRSRRHRRWQACIDAQLDLALEW